MVEFRLLLPDNLGGILGEVDERGELTFVVSAKPDSPIRGTELFDLMLRAFGERVRVVRGVSEGTPGNYSKIDVLLEKAEEAG